MSDSATIPSFDFAKFKSRFITKDLLPFDSSEGFRIFKIQDVIRYLKFPLPVHRTNYYDILFVIKGSKSVKNCGIRKYEIYPGNIFFKPGGQITSGDVLGKDVEGFFCLLDGDFLSKYLGTTIHLSNYPFFKFSGNPIVEVGNDEIRKFQFLFETIHKEYYADANGRPKNIIIASYLNVILQEAAALQRNQNEKTEVTGKSTEVLSGRFADLVAEHYLEKRVIKDYATLLCVTPNHLSKALKSATGKTATTLISEMLILEAKVLLKQTDKSVAEIADHLRFQDSSYFTRFFKKHTTMTPMVFRKLE